MSPPRPPLRLLWLLTLIAGCASARGPADGPGETAAELAALERQQAEVSAELEKPSAQGVALDCGRARTLRDNVCALADRICALTARDPTIPNGPARCQHARQRCQAARTRVDGPCGR